jgi:hypothetical protein
MAGGVALVPQGMFLQGADAILPAGVYLIKRSVPWLLLTGAAPALSPKNKKGFTSMCVPGGVRRFVLTCLPLFSLSVLAAGCGSGGTVSGKVYYKGQPLTGGIVHFVPEGKSGRFSSVIGTDGSYSVSKLPRGQAKISVSGSIAGAKGGPPAEVFKRRGGERIQKAFDKMGGKKGQSESGRGAGAGKSAPALPEKYGDPDESGLTINVTGSSQPFDINLD